MQERSLSTKLPVTIITAVAGLLVLPATTYANEPSSTPLKDTKSVSLISLAGTQEATIHVDLTGLRDWGLNIRQIKQQALDLYMEATRTKLTPDDGPDLIVPSEIPKATNIDYSKCLPPRPEWVAYFLNSIEPLTQ